jgi:hypothetical protein
MDTELALGNRIEEIAIIPAAGVIVTRPVIIPCTAPITLGLPNTMTSNVVHVSRLVAAHTWVLRTANPAIKLALNGAPPLKPDHPIHNSPAPVSMRSMLLGGNLSRSLGSLGPTCLWFRFTHHHSLSEGVRIIHKS